MHIQQCYYVCSIYGTFVILFSGEVKLDGYVAPRLRIPGAATVKHALRCFDKILCESIVLII